MPDQALPHVGSPEALTQVLRRCGALSQRDVVTSATVEKTWRQILSTVWRLRLGYEAFHEQIHEDIAPVPRTVILKTAAPNRETLVYDSGQHEVTFYAQLASEMPVGMVPRCYESMWDQQTRNWHLLLEDLTDSHQSPSPFPIPPSVERCRDIVRARARLHAYWWDHPSLSSTEGGFGAGGLLGLVMSSQAQRLPRFIELLGDSLSPERADLYSRLQVAAPRLMDRYLPSRHLTLVHGDAHVWNTLVPKAGGADVRFFDWDAWRLDIGAYDLAYMMALHWYPDYRRRMQKPLLDLYHAELMAHGVAGYDRRALDDDYRLCVLGLIMWPALQASVGVPGQVWWNLLERVMMAVDDLDCRELLG